MRDVTDAGIPADPGTANDTVVPNLAGRRWLLSGKDLQQCGLSRSAATGNGDELAWFHGQRQLLKDLPRADLPVHIHCFDPPADRCFVCVA